ncbi:MBL fold metallo-hydrolase [Aeromicrobium sp. CTD01-1L150]|uniref:MBL fold metallo-hydrolase n=1 Tax=Aeromicrobium sp. CTD01-1L150 TaxID=3341830 RepID=UPI0035BF800E
MWDVDTAPPVPGEPLEVAPGVHLVLAPNANAWTFEGTNTWILTSAGEAVVVDPGPDDPAHLDAIDAVVTGAGARVREVLLTHHHGDHSQAAAPLAARWKAPIRPRVQRGILAEGTRFDVGSLEAWSMRTPGHTSDGISLVLPRERLVLTGDTVIARVNSFIGHPDGTLSDMLGSMRRLAQVADDDWAFLPGHGPVVREPRRYVADRTSDRMRRVEQVAAHAVDGRSPEEIARTLHPRLDEHRLRAAQASVEAILHYLDHTPERT